MKRNYISLILLFVLFSCSSDYLPKPKGYNRLDLPEREFTALKNDVPYSFEHSVNATVEPDSFNLAEKYWINLNFPEFKATVHISYKEIDGNLVTYLEDAHTLVTKHISKADAISDSLIIDRSRNLFGLAYSLEGSGAASP